MGIKQLPAWSLVLRDGRRVVVESRVHPDDRVWFATIVFGAQRYAGNSLSSAYGAVLDALRWAVRQEAERGVAFEVWQIGWPEDVT